MSEKTKICYECEWSDGICPKCDARIAWAMRTVFELGKQKRLEDFV